MFGVQIKKIETEKEYTIEGLYEAIRDKPLSAGNPTIVKHGLVMLIAFPALDRQNQVQITSLKAKGPSRKFQIQKAEAAGVGNMAGNMVIDKLTGGLFGFKQVVGGNAKRCEELVKITAQELDAMKL